MERVRDELIKILLCPGPPTESSCWRTRGCSPRSCRNSRPAGGSSRRASTGSTSWTIPSCPATAPRRGWNSGLRPSPTSGSLLCPGRGPDGPAHLPPPRGGVRPDGGGSPAEAQVPQRGHRRPSPTWCCTTCSPTTSRGATPRSAGSWRARDQPTWRTFWPCGWRTPTARPGNGRTRGLEPLRRRVESPAEAVPGPRNPGPGRSAGTSWRIWACPGVRSWAGYWRNSWKRSWTTRR
ncbi:MAG: hypothetical protein MZU97_07950 [Bacillus subtilis]|nr:hypothetical protein [Bacillus subtilis]